MAREFVESRKGCECCGITPAEGESAEQLPVIKKGKKKKKKEHRKLSLQVIGKIIDREMLQDRFGHIYIWDPRYKKRKVEDECRKQETINAILGNGDQEDDEHNFINIIGRAF